jgi:hypothetical protein
MTQFWQLEQIAKLIFPRNVSEKMEIVKRAFGEYVGGIYGDDRKFIPLMDAIVAKQEELSKTIRAELPI